MNDMSQLNLQHYNQQLKSAKQKKNYKVKTDMLKSNSKSMRNHVVSPEEEEERLQCQQWEGFVETSGA